MIKNYEYKVETLEHPSTRTIEVRLKNMRELGWTPISVSHTEEFVLITYETWRKVKR